MSVRITQRLRIGWGWGWGGGDWGGDWGGLGWHSTFHLEQSLSVDIATSSVHSGTARHPADAPLESPRRMIAWVGGLRDRKSGVVKEIYESNLGSIGAENTEYFEHTEMARLAKWLRNNSDAHLTIIGHSMGGWTAARVVAEGNYVDVLVTVDPATGYRLRRPRFKKVVKHSGAWHNYYSVNREYTDGSNVVAELGRAWNDAPEGFANPNVAVEMSHVKICTAHCAPPR